MTKPYATWGIGHPSPKEVYAAYSDTYVGYVPIGWRIRAKVDGTLEAITALEGALLDITGCHFLSKTGQITEDHPGIMSRVKDIPLWQARFAMVLQQYPRFKSDSSFYLFEHFVINDDRDTLLWTKYTRKAAWAPLTQLELLKP